MINGFRFIIGSGCNYDCFFCHHEGYKKNSFLVYDKQKLVLLCDFAKQNHIKDISITGGEPFLYLEKLKMLLEVFSPKYFRITLNTNASLVDSCVDFLSALPKIEFHVNLSSLNSEKHANIIGNTYLNKIINNLKILKENGHDVCLNIPVLNTLNDDELIDLFKFCCLNEYKPRFLVLYDVDNQLSNYALDIQGIMNKFTNSKIKKVYSYGRYDIESNEGDFEIVRCLCVKHECDKCKENTYIHFTPNLNMKYCMEREEEIAIDYSDVKGIENSVRIFSEKLNEILRKEKV